MELTVATAIMATIFAATMPLFVGIRHSTDTRWASLEMLQNARVLNEHLGRYLAQARRIVAVSASTDSAGCIEWEGEDGVVYRCAVGARGYVEFGAVGDRREPGNSNATRGVREFLPDRWNTFDSPVTTISISTGPWRRRTVFGW